MPFIDICEDNYVLSLIHLGDYGAWLSSSWLIHQVGSTVFPCSMWKGIGVFVFPEVPSVCFCAPSGLFTLTGVSIYIRYSNQAMDEFQRTVSPEDLTTVDVSFGWSLAIAWLSYSLEVATGLLLMLAARITQMKGHYDSGVTIAML